MSSLPTAIARFLQYLRAERNASDLTIKSYREDLQALEVHLTQTHGQCPAAGEITTLDLRGYISSLHTVGYAKTTVARRLASLRSFFRFGAREGWSQDQPGQAAAQSAQGALAAALPLGRGNRSGCSRHPPRTKPSACAIGPCWRRCIRPACASASWRA